MPKEFDGRPSYLVINAMRGARHLQDREIMRHDPHKLLEGCLLAGFAMGAAPLTFIFEASITTRRGPPASGQRSIRRWLNRQERMRFDYDFDIYVHRGAGAYICGEETALLESLKARKDSHASNRRSPPQLAYGAVLRHEQRRNNCRCPDDPALQAGCEFWSREQSRYKIFCISRHVEKPCVVEDALSIPLRELMETHAGGVRGGWDNLKAVIPGGSSMPLLPKSVCDDLIMDFDALVAAQSSLGTAAIIVMDQSTDIIKAIARIAYFYKHESCGQCTPCREGSGWMWRILERMVKGEAEVEEIDLLWDVTKQIEGHTICAFGDAAAWPVQGLLRHFRGEIEHRILNARALAPGGGVGV